MSRPSRLAAVTSLLFLLAGASAASAQTLWISDDATHRIYEVTLDGELIRFFPASQSRTTSSGNSSAATSGYSSSKPVRIDATWDPVSKPLSVSRFQISRSLAMDRSASPVACLGAEIRSLDRDPGTGAIFANGHVRKCDRPLF